MLLRKLMFTLAIVFVGQSYAEAQTFTGVTPQQIEACENHDRYDYCRVYNLLDRDEYTLDRVEIYSALRAYFVDTTRDRTESVRIQNIEKTKDGSSNGSTNFQKRTDYLVEFIHNQGYSYSSTRCQVKLMRIEGSDQVLSLNTNTLKCGADLAKPNFLELTPQQVASEESRSGKLRSMVDRYVTEQKKILDALDVYFIARDRDDESISINEIKKIKSGVWHGQTKAAQKSAWKVSFRNGDRSPYSYNNCSVLVRTLEKRGGPSENNYWVQPSSKSCTRVTVSPY